MKRTKIIATLGPSSSEPKIIETLVKRGVNVFRLNFSHGTHEEHLEMIRCVRKISQDLEIEIAILADLQGPKIRIGEYSGFLKKGDQVILACDEALENEIPVQYTKLYMDVQSGDRLLLDDGLIELRVIDIKSKKIITKVIVGGKLTSKKGINLPTGSISAEVITEKDKNDAVFALESGVDFLALSFVKNEKDIIDLKEIIKTSKNPYARVIAKIERHEAVKNFEKILVEADAIMVARGDLGIETSQQKVPLLQKHMVKRCLAVGKPSIVATQMLDSMIRNPRSTRAETSDIANAILDGADAIMLSGETASGKYPLEAVAAMNRIALDTESWILDNKIQIGEHVKRNTHKTTDAIAQAAVMLANETKSKYIITATTRGVSATAVAKFRPHQPIIGVTSSRRTARSLALSWGVAPKYMTYGNNREMVDAVSEGLTASNKAKGSDVLTIVSGYTHGEIGGTNMIRIHEI